jgi:hypothetical protein
MVKLVKEQLPCDAQLREDRNLRHQYAVLKIGQRRPGLRVSVHLYVEIIEDQTEW